MFRFTVVSDSLWKIHIIIEVCTLLFALYVWNATCCVRLCTGMIGFVTWPPFSYHYYKGGQVTKPIILVKIYYKLLYAIQVVKKIFDK